jgi:hypothetical protein
VVGSDVGGIAEVIGHDNVVPLGEGFEKKTAEKVVEMLTAKPSQKLPDNISWSKTALLELEQLKALR